MSVRSAEQIYLPGEATALSVQSGVPGGATASGQPGGRYTSAMARTIAAGLIVLAFDYEALGCSVWYGVNLERVVLDRYLCAGA